MKETATSDHLQAQDGLIYIVHQSMVIQVYWTKLSEVRKLSENASSSSLTSKSSQSWPRTRLSHWLLRSSICPRHCGSDPCTKLGTPECGVRLLEEVNGRKEMAEERHHPICIWRLGVDKVTNVSLLVHFALFTPCVGSTHFEAGFQ